MYSGGRRGLYRNRQAHGVLPIPLLLLMGLRPMTPTFIRRDQTGFFRWSLLLRGSIVSGTVAKG